MRWVTSASCDNNPAKTNLAHALSDLCFLCQYTPKFLTLTGKPHFPQLSPEAANSNTTVSLLWFGLNEGKVLKYAAPIYLQPGLALGHAMGVWVNGRPPKASPYQPPTPALDLAPAGLQAWAARAQATCHVWGLASSTSSAHRTVQKQFWFFVDSVARCSFDEFAAAPTEGLCAFAQWCSERDKCKAFGPLRAASVEQYVGSLISALRIRHTPLKVDRARLNFFFGALLRQETHCRGPPPLKKAPLTADMLDTLCATPPYEAVSSAVSAGRPPPQLAPRAFNAVMAAAAACYSLATGARASSVASPSQLEFNPLIHAARGDIHFSPGGFRYEHKPCKNDKHAKIWKGPSPLFPAVPGRLCCPLKALQVRDALLPSADPADPLFAVYARDGTLRPLTCKQLKSLALDKLLHMCPASCTSVSARVGHATAAFSAGMPADSIKQFGKWRSDTWRTYARVTDEAARQYVSAVFS